MLGLSFVDTRNRHCHALIDAESHFISNEFSLNELENEKVPLTEPNYGQIVVTRMFSSNFPDGWVW